MTRAPPPGRKTGPAMTTATSPPGAAAPDPVPATVDGIAARPREDPVLVRSTPR